jgi:hypothetical protein
VDGMPVHIAEAKYNNMKRLMELQIKKEQQELDKINAELEKTENETKPTAEEPGK